MWNLEIAVDDVRGAEIARFLNAHVEQLRLISPPESCHVLDLEGLRGPEVTVWTARIGDEIVAQPYFAPARRLYARHGFSECPPFGAYHADPLSVFMTVGLIARPGSS